MTPHAERLAAIRAQLVRDQADRVEESTRAGDRAWMLDEIDRLERALRVQHDAMESMHAHLNKSACAWCRAWTAETTARIREALGEGGGDG